MSGRIRPKSRLRTTLTTALDTAIEPRPRMAPRRSGPLRRPSRTPMANHRRPWLAAVDRRRSQRSTGVVGSRPMNACRRTSRSWAEGIPGR
jgi:hypothetical protein